MKVTNIRTLHLAGPDQHGLGGAFRTWNILLVRIDTDAGIYGLGEAPYIMGVHEAIDYIKEYLVGKNPFDIRPLTTAMLYGMLPPAGEPSMSPTATPTGPIVWGCSGIDMALCDIVGKALNTPVYNLFGGKYRDKVRIYLDRSGAEEVDNIDEWKALATNAVERGFGAMKFDIDFCAPDCTEDLWNRAISRRQLNKIVERLTAVREAVGPDIEVAVDGHMYYNTSDALRVAKELEPLKLMWLEDPTPITNLDAMKLIRQKSNIPICLGEMFIPEQFRMFIDHEACDIIHPDALFVGGLHEMRKVADYADLHYIPLAMHNNGCALNTIASSHIAVASRNFLGLEYHFHDSPWIGQVVRREGQPLFTHDGYVELTDAPGLGIEIDTEICDKYKVAGEELF